ncbi:uncharacterized protein KY384_001634 [Bacidia gigantensis]|uniref:uncharacterized protein n=1 Tax=Bacidia gigantensis TaxID=2732470 RepID=UPI001D04574A|nr:uncharacterized protein KY384_001634 [Bacidia gigantensis]KAG8533893.1 hypothetical protein KY384_001634 [Bacidia gigantensis]
MQLLAILLCLYATTPSVIADQWPYHRVVGDIKDNGDIVPIKSKPEFKEHPDNLFVGWLRDVLNNANVTSVEHAFVNGTLPDDAKWFDDVLDSIKIPANFTPAPIKVSPNLPNFPLREATQLFSHLQYPLDPRCTVDRSRWFYRTDDGSCNWLKKDDFSTGATGMPKVRDYNQHYYADGISKPREGPNARAVSNAFFKRKKELYYEHTPLLLGLIEFIMHDVTYSQDSPTEYVDVPMPEDEKDYALNTTLRVWRTAAVPGTGTDTKNPREIANMATTWLDVSALYGSTPEVLRGLRSFSGGKLLSQEVQARGTNAKASYLPFNTMNVPTNTRPGIDPMTLFGGGDARTNEDWMLLGVHTLLLREHNRLCDILAKQHPEYDDEQLYQTIRLALSAKYALIANSYQMAYWTKTMPWPQDDGFPLYRQMYGQSALKINPANTYPWPLVTKKGKPMVVSAEMSVLYRFHEFIISSFNITDAASSTLWVQDLFSTGFNASGFIEAGLENVLRGMAGTNIPNFKSGVDEKFRSAGKYRGKAFDIVTWSIIHEREQGLPTFNNYFREYNKLDPQVEVHIRSTFEDFSSDPEMVKNLRKLYKSPDEVDFVVGVQLDEEMFPGTTVPRSALIVSLFSLFGMGNSDRFSVGFAMMRCLLVDKPWDCHPSNGLEDLIWARKKVDGFPDFRFYDKFWLTELDLQSHGTNLLWRLITENTEIKCVQHSPLFPADPKTNPILCTLPKAKQDLKFLALSVLQLILALIKQHYVKIIVVIILLIALITLIIVWRRRQPRLALPPALQGWPILGNALAFQKDSKALLLRGFHKFQPFSGCFGIKLASLTHYVLTKPEDLDIMKEDNAYEVKLNEHAFMEAINISIITKKENFDSDIHNRLIRNHFSDPSTVAGFATTIEEAAQLFVKTNPLSTSKSHDDLNDYFSRYIAFVVSRCVVGPKEFDRKELLDTFLKFNTDAINAMGLSSMLPKFLRFLAAIKINRHFKTIRNILVPMIASRRSDISTREKESAFVNFIMDVVDNNDRVADIVAIVVWAGLTNLQATFSSTILDIINQPGLQDTVLSSLSNATLSNLDAFTRSSSEWQLLRSATFESIRLSGPTTGPARICTENVQLRSDPSLTLPKGQAATLSSYYTHRQNSTWGDDADRYKHTRFMEADPPVGEPRFVTWGLKGPHACPGRWFAVQTIQIMVKVLLETYEFKQEKVLRDEEKYLYKGGMVERAKVGVEVKRR